jgi:hypothetical protein
MTASRLVLVLVFAFLGLFAGCATPYQKAGATGGYSETRLDEHVARVVFNGNGYTSGERAADFCMLRCAELTLEHGCRYFTVLQGGDSASYSTYTTPTTSYTTGTVNVNGNTAYGSATTNTYGGQTYNIRKPSSTLLIACSPEKPAGQVLVLDAKFICSSIRTKYRLTSPTQGSSDGKAPDQSGTNTSSTPVSPEQQDDGGK